MLVIDFIRLDLFLLQRRMYKKMTLCFNGMKYRKEQIFYVAVNI